MNETLHNEALLKLLAMSRQDFLSARESEKQTLLMNLKAERAKEEERKKEKKRLMEQGRDHYLLCGKCSTPAILSDDLRKINRNHHVVIGNNFLPEMVKIEPEPSKECWPWWFQVGKMYCKAKGCDQFWGPLCLYQNTVYPLPKIEKFTVSDYHNKPTILKWKDCPFAIEKHQPWNTDLGDEEEGPTPPADPQPFDFLNSISRGSRPIARVAPLASA